MILHLTVLLVFQLIGEVLSRSFGLSIPGPVIGMAFLFVALVAFPRLAEAIGPTAKGLLGHLSLLFVPAGVGVVGHLGTLGTDGFAIAVAIVGSTVLALLAGVGTFLGVAWLTGQNND